MLIFLGVIDVCLNQDEKHVCITPEMELSDLLKLFLFVENTKILQKTENNCEFE